MQFKNIFRNFFAYQPPKTYDFNLAEDSIQNSQGDTDFKAQKEYEIKKIFPSLSINLDYMKTKYNLLINSDIILREFTLNARGKQYNAFLFYIDGMVDSKILDDFVLEPLMMRNKNNSFDGSQHKVISEAVTNNITVRKVKKFDLSSYVINCLMPQNTVKTQDEFSSILNGINSRKLCFIY